MCKHLKFFNKGVISNLSFWKIIRLVTKRQKWGKLEAGKHHKGGVHETGKKRGFKRYTLPKLSPEYLKAFQVCLWLFVFKQVPSFLHNSPFFAPLYITYSDGSNYVYINHGTLLPCTDPLESNLRSRFACRELTDTHGTVRKVGLGRGKIRTAMRLQERPLAALEQELQRWDGPSQLYGPGASRRWGLYNAPCRPLLGCELSLGRSNDLGHRVYLLFQAIPRKKISQDLPTAISLLPQEKCVSPKGQIWLYTRGSTTALILYPVPFIMMRSRKVQQGVYRVLQLW